MDQLLGGWCPLRRAISFGLHVFRVPPGLAPAEAGHTQPDFVKSSSCTPYLASRRVLARDDRMPTRGYYGKTVGETLHTRQLPTNRPSRQLVVPESVRSAHLCG